MRKPKRINIVGKERNQHIVDNFVISSYTFAKLASNIINPNFKYEYHTIMKKLLLLLFIIPSLSYAQDRCKGIMVDKDEFRATETRTHKRTETRTD